MSHADNAPLVEVIAEVLRDRYPMPPGTGTVGFRADSRAIVEALGARLDLIDAWRLTTRTAPTRPEWDAYFYGVARAVSARADCSRRQVGAVIVDAHRRIISTGYNGTPPGSPLSCLAGDCPRAQSNAKPGEGGYEECIALHAEQNAIANAKGDLRGGTIYITTAPCSMCSKLCAAAGLEVRYP